MSGVSHRVQRFQVPGSKFQVQSWAVRLSLSKPRRTVAAALRQAQGKQKIKKGVKIIWLSPSGKQFDNKYAEKISKKYKDIIIICGRYEGVDERVRKIFSAKGGSAFGMTGFRRKFSLIQYDTLLKTSL